MKKLLIGCVALLAACAHQSQSGIYVNSGQNEYTVSDDTLLIKEGIVTNNSGFNKIRNGKLKSRQFTTKEWRLHEAGTPVITFQKDGLLLGNSFYKKID